MQKKRICFILPLVFIAFTVAFIWSNSLANGEQSTAQSGFFSDLFARIFDITRPPFDFLNAFGRFRFRIFFSSPWTIPPFT